MCLAKINQVGSYMWVTDKCWQVFYARSLTRDCMQIDYKKNYTVPNCNYLAIIPTNDVKRFK